MGVDSEYRDCLEIGWKQVGLVMGRAAQRPRDSCRVLVCTISGSHAKADKIVCFQRKE